jgi:prepilin-type processing-associated H-X9-DG protein/prepilin-type N-terminal cleavage/methylation domain-containing protein
MNGCTSRRAGFTLIEILIVIAIIILLAAILFPAFSRARASAKRASCQSNLKQLELAFAQYINDNDSRYPHAWDVNPLSAAGTSSVKDAMAIGTTNDPVVWPAKIMPYVKSRQVFHCPSFDYSFSGACDTVVWTIKQKHGWQDTDPVVGSGIYGTASYVQEGASLVHYGYNVVFIGGGVYGGEQAHGCQGSSPANGIGALESQLEAPASTLLLVDNNYAHGGLYIGPAFAVFTTNNVDGGGNLSCKSDNTTAEAFDSFDGRHFGGMNVLFADGHVKWMKKEDVLYKPPDFVATCGVNTNWSSTDPRYIWNRK